MNPVNEHKLLQIEDFWGILKQIVYEKGWSAKSVHKLKIIIERFYKKLRIVSSKDSIHVEDMATMPFNFFLF